MLSAAAASATLPSTRANARSMAFCRARRIVSRSALPSFFGLPAGLRFALVMTWPSCAFASLPHQVTVNRDQPVMSRDFLLDVRIAGGKPGLGESS